MRRAFKLNWSTITFPYTSTLMDPLLLQDPAPLHYLDIPLRLSHTVGTRSLRWISSVGLSVGFLLPTHDRTAIINGYQPALFISYPRELNISPTLSSGLAFFLADHSDLRVEPTFMYGITALTDNSVQTFLWSAGLNVGYYRRF